jgi:hypothetical protein
MISTYILNYWTYVEEITGAQLKADLTKLKTRQQQLEPARWGGRGGDG